MVNLTNLPDDIIHCCIKPFLKVAEYRSLLDTKRNWYEYKKRSWYVTIKNPDILNNLNILNSLVINTSIQIELYLRNLKITDISALSNVHTLDLSDCNGITDVSALSNVHSLNLSDCNGITDVSALSNVHSLNLSGCNDITDISALSNVHTLNLSYCYGIVKHHNKN